MIIDIARCLDKAYPDRIRASIGEDANIQGVGRTLADAIADMIVKHAEELGIIIQDLKPDHVYEVLDGELAVFKHIGNTGYPVFQPLGEPSFQDIFLLKDPHVQVKRLVRKATKKDLGG